MTSPAPPSSGLRWLTPGVLLVPALVLGGIVLQGSVMSSPAFTGRALEPAQWGSPVVWGSKLLAIVAWALLALWATRGPTRVAVVARAAAGGLLAGLLELAVVTLWGSLLPTPGQDAWGQVAPSLPLAAAAAYLRYWSIPMNVALGLGALALVLPAAEATKRASLDGVDNAAAHAGAWLLASGAIGLWLLKSTPLAPLAGLAVALGAFALLAAQVRTEERVGWLRRVQAGLEPGVTVDEDASSLAGVKPLVAEIDLSGVARSGVVVHRGPARGKAYRAGEGARTPLARVPLDDRPLRTAWGALVDAQGRASLGQIGLGFVSIFGFGLAGALAPFALALVLRNLY